MIYYPPTPMSTELDSSLVFRAYVDRKFRKKKYCLWELNGSGQQSDTSTSCEDQRSQIRVDPGPSSQESLYFIFFLFSFLMHFTYGRGA